MTSDPSSQPTQPLTDKEWARIEEMTVRTPRMFDFGTRRLIATIQEARGALAVRRLEADRLRAELDSMTRFAEDLREERDRRLRSEGERGVERDALAAKIEATAELHPAWFCETCNSPGPCLTRLRLGLDQDGRGQ